MLICSNNVSTAAYMKYLFIKNPEAKDLKVRKWTCPVCGTVHDRDRNSAVNLKQEGIRILEEKNVMVL